ncbi:MAG: PD-(D/E)XK nuclease family protein [Verrucomicrobia bacterium]|nr:PD-(D/E)XK nuclease family protein [Verrucomicrobiota bacterium]
MTQPAVQARAFDLLRLAKNLRHYEATFARAGGEGFNIFDILGVGHYEVRTHSPLLAELLSPRGSHGHGSAFLRHFIARLGLGPFEVETATVSQEFSLGPQTEEEGGLLDILVRDGLSREILIENKIYAGEQLNQLGRYQNFSPKGALIYLTLHGDAPEKTPVEGLLNLKCISYRSDIIGWLQDCRKEATNAPGVRETITQYIHLIQKLTQQNTSTRMNQELVKTVLQDEESFLAYAALHKATPDIRLEVIKTLRAQLVEIANILGLQLDFNDGDLDSRFDGFDFTNSLLSTKNLRIRFEFNNSRYRECYFGFKYLDKEGDTTVTQRIHQGFKVEFGVPQKSTEWWAAWTWWVPNREWTDDTFAAIRFGNFVNDLKKLLERMLKIANHACSVDEPPLIK